MRILLASSEVHPFSKTGGLADMVGALAKYLANAGHRVGVVTPLYRGLEREYPAMKSITRGRGIKLALGSDWVAGDVKCLRVKENLEVYFVEQPDFFDRPGLYGAHKKDFTDNGERFIYFSKCVAHLAQELDWAPELVHVHDWQVGLVPLLLHEQRRDGGAPDRPGPACCVTVHNLAYQGVFPASLYPLTGLPASYYRMEGVEFFGGFNCLKAAIVYADSIITVSPRYAKEITTPEYGCGLEGVLLKRSDRLIGILNGVDYEEWNTTQNPNLEHPYSIVDLTGKTKEKLRLQRNLGLPVSEAIPLFANVSRLVEQKGSDLLLVALEEMLASGLQFVLLGSGSEALEDGYLDLARRYPHQIAVRIGYDYALAHQIEAGADFFLMPSRFEPCGLNQMYSLRYGTIPIVRATGGLDDSVIDARESVERADGIKFKDPNALALSRAIRKGLVLHGNSDWFAWYRRNAMSADFSWRKTAGEYEEVYERTLKTAVLR